MLAVLAGLIFFAEAGNLLEVFSIESEKLFVPSLVLVRPSHDGLGCSKRLSCLESFKSQHKPRRAIVMYLIQMNPGLNYQHH